MTQTYSIFHGYKMLAETENVADAEQFCTDYCAILDEGLEFSRKLVVSDAVSVLLYKGPKLHIETFAITSDPALCRQKPVL